MAKIFNALLFVFSLFACLSFSGEIKNDYMDKVSYENFGEYHGMSSTSDDYKVVDTKIVVSVYFGYGSFDKNSVLRSYSNVANEKGTEKEVDDYLKALRDKGKGHYNKNNLDIDKELKMEEYESKYVCNYLPMIEYTYDKDVYSRNSHQILKLAAEKNIVTKVIVSRMDEVEYVGQLEGAMEVSNGRLYYLDETYTGNNVVIGVLDTGIFNYNNSIFSNLEYEYYSQNNAPITVHATDTAAVISSNNGIAKDAKLLSAGLVGTPTDELEWMISKNVNVINISLGENNPSGTYLQFSAICDYFVREYDVTIVAAAGNYGASNGYVTNPGLSYNTITVAAAALNNTVYSFSSYKTINDRAKPDMAAYGGAPAIEDYVLSERGTSVSSVVATGLVALLMESSVHLKTKPEKVKGLFIANSITVPFYSYSLQNGMDEDFGAGIIDIKTSVQQIGKATAFLNTYGVAGTVALSIPLTIQANHTLKIGFTWLVNADGTTSGTSFTKYVLRLYDDNGNILCESNSLVDNTQMIEYNCTTLQSFYVRVIQISSAVDTNSTQTTDRLCMAYGVRAND